MTTLPAVVEGSTSSSLQYITFRVGEEIFGVDIMYIEEIISPKKTTVIPRTPDYFKGIINLRGEVISIIDLRSRFGMERQENTDLSRIIVIRSKDIKLGMLVDSINRIVNLDKKDIRTASKLVSTDRQKYISGSYKLSNDDILLLLHHEEIVDEDDFHVHQEVQLSAKDTQSQIIEQAEENIPEIFLVGFSIQNEQFAIESLLVEEIIQLPEITPVPEMENFVEGIFHLRESVIPIIRLGNRLELKKIDLESSSLVIIAKIKDVKVGLIVDQITEVYIIKENEVVPPPINLNPKQLEQLRGVIKLERNKSNLIVMLLKLENLFSFEEHDKLKDLEQDEDSESTDLVAQEDLEEEVPILEFMLSNERYAIPVMITNEIIPVREVVPVPKAPVFIRGVVNLRGEVISIVDLPMLVEHDGYIFDEQTKFLIANPGNEKAGLVVEKVLGIKKALLSTFEPPSGLLQQKGNIFIKGIGKDEKTGEIIILMDLEKTLQQAQSVNDLSDLKDTIQELELLDKEDEETVQESTEN